MPVACALIPRFRLIAAVGRDGEILRRPAALAPEPGTAQLIGEVTAAAERFGLRAGMGLGEALSRCPELALIPPDAERAERSWEEALRRLEGIGAEVESDRAGEAFFEAGGLAGLWGGIEGVLESARRELGRRADRSRARTLLLVRGRPEIRHRSRRSGGEVPGFDPGLAAQWAPWR